MMDLLFSILVLTYFTLTPTKPDTCYYMALTYNLLHILSHTLILIPILYKLATINFHSITYTKIKRMYIRSIMISKIRMPIFCTLVIGGSITCLYSMVVEIFVWENYGYLFSVFCLVGSTLSEVSAYMKVKFDCSIFFSLETYKFFCLCIASILFGISAHEIKLSAEVLGMSWAYFVYRSKQSLPKEVVYYLIVFMDVVLLLTAIMVIGSSQGLMLEENRVKNKTRLFFAVTFFGVLFCMEIYQFMQLYRSFGRSGQFGGLEDHQKSISKFYVNMDQFRQRQTQNTPDQECSICLQDINTKKQKGQRLVLLCKHHFHSECLEEWAFINHTCPMCRKSMVQGLDEQITL